MTELPNEYARRVVALRLLSAVGHTHERQNFEQTLDDAMDDPNLRDAIAWLCGLAMEAYRSKVDGDWGRATAEIDAQLRLAEGLEGLGHTDEPGTRA